MRCKMVEKQEDQSLEEIASLLINDKLTFLILASILSHPCEKILTDRE